MIKHYASIADLGQAYATLCAGKTLSYSGSDWYGGETEAASLAYAQAGNAALVPQTEALLAQFENVIETPRKIWERSPAGAFACIPDVLAGRPTPMRRQAFVRDETAPLTVLTCTTSSGAISANALQKRGASILALVMALVAVRPVRLLQIACLHGAEGGETVLTAEINTHPLDLATACYALTSAGFARRLTYGLARHLNNFDGSWPREFNSASPKPYYDALTLRLGLSLHETLFIGAAHSTDPLLSKPAEWLAEQITRFTQVETEL